MLKGAVAALAKRIGFGDFALRVGMVAGGAAIGQIVLLLISPVLTRLYSADDFGALAVYVSLLSLGAVVVSLRFELAIPMAEDQHAAYALLVLAVGVTAVMALLSAVAVAFGGIPLAHLLNTPDLAPYLFLLPVGLLGFGVYQAFNYWAIRDKDFSNIALTKLNQSLGQSGTQIGLGTLWGGPAGLIVGHVVGQVLGTGTLIRSARKRHGVVLRAVSVDAVRRVVVRYRRFPLFSSFSGFLNTAGLQAPVLMIAGVYGADVAGWFALANRVVGAPLGLVGNAVAQVYLAEAPAMAREDPKGLGKLFRISALRLTLIGAAVVTTIVAGGATLFAMVFGEGWAPAGTFAQILGPMFLAQFVVVPLSQTLNVLERQDLQLAWDAGRLLLVTGMLWFGGAAGWSAAWSIAGFSAAMVISYALLLFLSGRVLGKVVSAPGLEN